MTLMINDYTESGLAEIAEKRKIVRKSIVLGRKSTEKQNVVPFKRKDRWEYWDTISDCEDIWIVVDEVDKRRKSEIREENQIKHLECKRKNRIAHKKIDISRFLEDEPYADMCHVPNPANGIRNAGRSKENQKHAEEDRKIIAENRSEIELMMREGKSAYKVSNEFGINYQIFLKIVKEWR